MSDRVEWFQVTIPAGTPQSAPVTIPCVFQQGEVVEIDIKVPPGPSGSLGFFIAAGGSQYVPRTSGSFVMPDNDFIRWPLSNAINSGSWAVTGFNTGLYNHTIQVSFQINEIDQSATTGTQPTGASSAALASALPLATFAAVAPADPLSPDALVASVPADTVT